jgi:hypothetical protein
LAPDAVVGIGKLETSDPAGVYSSRKTAVPEVDNAAAPVPTRHTTMLPEVNPAEGESGTVVSG